MTTTATAEPKLEGRSVPDAARRVLLDIMQRSGLSRMRVTSTTRTAAQQAKVMYQFVNKNGYQAGLELYGPHGDAIIRVCADSYKQHAKCLPEVLPKMVEETRHQIKLLERQGDQRTELMHTSDTHYTIDIAPDSVSDRAAFERVVAAHDRVSRFLKPPMDRNSYHLEIPRS